MRDNPKRATYLFLQLTLTFSAVVWVLVIWSGHLAMGFGLMVPAIMLVPGNKCPAKLPLTGAKISTIGLALAEWDISCHSLLPAYRLCVPGLRRRAGVAPGSLELGIHPCSCRGFRTAWLARMGFAYAIHFVDGHRRRSAESLDGAG